MTYLSGKTQKRNKFLRYFLYVSLFLFIFIFWSTIKSKLYPIFEPVVIKYSSAREVIGGIPNFFSTYISSRKKLIQKDKALEVTIENLENQIAEKNAKLKELDIVVSEFGDSSPSSTIILYPVMTDVTKLYSTMLLSKGYKDGVEKDMYVYVRGLQPVCIIKEVYTSTSLCELLSSRSVSTEVVIESSSSSSISLNLVGRGGGSFLGDAARDTPISIGDKVFLKSDPSMKLGTVVDVIHNNQDTSWRVFVRGEFNPVTSSIFYIRKK